MLKGGEEMARKIRKIKASAIKLLERKKICAYARVSSGKDAMLHSLSAQISYYNDYIQKRPEWEFVGVYADDALTGTKDTRDEFQRMIQDCREGKIDLIITKSISRFARNTLTMLEVVRELKDINVDVYFENENIHSMSGDGELMLTILASFAQEESRSVSENCKWRIRKGFAEGELINLRFMYGYNIDEEITINEEEAEIVRMIFNDYLNGMGTTSIAKKLYELEVDRPRGGKWNSERVAEILRNEKYIGDALLQKKYVENHLTKTLVRNKGDLPQYYVENSHPAIIDKEIFEKVQYIMEERRNKFVGKESRSASPLKSKLVCDNCGKNYRRKSGHGRVYWACSTYTRYGKEHCNSRQIPEEILLEVTTEVLDLEGFNEEIFNEEIEHVEICNSNRLKFVFRDGEIINKTWEHKPRSESWDEEARQRAKERGLKQWEEMRHASSKNSYSNTCKGEYI